MNQPTLVAHAENTQINSKISMFNFILLEKRKLILSANLMFPLPY